MIRGLVMRLNQASDFALRILMLLSTEHEALTVDAVASRLGLARSHVMKIVAKLAHAGHVNAQRGRSGGVTLGQAPEDILVGDVVRLIEADFAIVECMTAGKSSCTFAPRCKLKGAMSQAGEAFLKVLDGYSLAAITPKTSAVS